MLMKFAAALLAIILSAGSVYAITRAHSHAFSFAHFDTCSEGLVKKICVCRAANEPRRFGLCRSGRYCNTFSGACTK